MRWSLAALAAVAAIGVAVACGSGSGSSREVLPPGDAGADAGPDGGGDAGPDGGTDAGTDGGSWRAGDVIMVPNGAGWRFAADGLPSDSVIGASADDDGNVWVAGGSVGVFVQRGGSGRFQQFTIADGLHPYGYLAGWSPADSGPRLAARPASSTRC